MGLVNLKIGKRLGFGFGVMATLLAGSMLFSMLTIGRVHNGADTLINDNMPKIIAAYELVGHLNDSAIALRNAMLSVTDEDKTTEFEAVKASRSDMDEQYETLKKLVTDDAGKVMLAKMMEHHAKVIKSQDEAIAMLKDGRQTELREFVKTVMRPELKYYKYAIYDLVNGETSEAGQLGDEIQKMYASSRIFTIVLGLGSLLFALGVGYWITVSITRPLREALKVANTVASGDLTSQINVKSKDEVGQLLEALRAMNDSLVRTVSQVRAGSKTIAIASENIATGTQDLSSRTEQQASSLEETAASMEELTGTVRQNADNARQANTLAETASSVAVKGGDVIGEVVSTMSEINSSAKKIVDIIGVIDGIAFQTNILALNAAVEAARAGEQGRGFAVVAGEVRNLAQRSASAAKEIKTLISNSVDKVESGAKLVNTAGETMQEIVDSVKRVTDIMGEIAAASQEQNSGIGQINQAVLQMDQTTQQNASLVQSSASSASALQEQAKKLSEVVAFFKVEDVVAPSPVSEKVVAEVKPKAALGHNPKRTVKTIPHSEPKASIEIPKADSEGDWEEF